MVARKSFRIFDESVFNSDPCLRQFLKPNDQYPELVNITKKRSVKLPSGSLNTKVIINDGEIVERVYMTPKGEVVSLFSKSLNSCREQAA
tara:strand:- start:177 stop:446 length:270 start_codon:yes stop_codon:yes gene_type:complete